MGKYKHYKGNVGGGVDVSHKSKMSGKAKSLMSFPGGMPGPGEYGKVENKVVSKGMMKYLSGEPVGMGKYKDKGMPQYSSDAQRKAAHASMAEQGAGKYGKHMGPEKAKTMVKGPDGKMVPDYAVDGKGSGDLKKSAPGMYGKKKKGPAKMDPKKSKKDTYREGGKKPILTPAQKKKREENLKNADKSVPKRGPAKMKSKGPKKELLTVRQEKEALKNKKQPKNKKSDLTLGNTTVGKTFGKAGGDLKFKTFPSTKSSNKKSMSDGEKIKASKAKKEAAGNKKKAEGQADLQKAKSQKFISRGSGEDSGIATREERRKAIRDARSKKREGRREARKARRKTVIKQKV